MKKEEETEALKECYSDPFMTSGEVDTLPSSTGLYTVKAVVDLGWVRARNLIMVLLRCVDHWVHKSHQVCKNTRNCILCNAGDSRLKQVGLVEQRAERLMFRKESDIITKVLPSQHLERFRRQEGIL